jgi:hypothetical protein
MTSQEGDLMHTFSDIDSGILDWVGRLGAAAAGDVAARFCVDAAHARARLNAGVRAGRLRSVRLLHGEPPLYVATRAGLRVAGLDALAPCRVSASAFAHHAACARVAVALSRAHPHARLASERELRLAERRAGEPIASAEVGIGRDGKPALHRPDLVLFAGGGPVAIEVELTVKSPLRLRQIVRGWARCRLVDRVVYYAPARPARALGRAIDELRAAERVVVMPLPEAGASEAIAIAA